LLIQLLNWIGTNARVLYWPMAQPNEGRRHEQCLAWLTEVLRPMGITSISMWSDFSGRSPEQIAEHDAVFIGGGCTYLLLHELKESGFDRALIEFYRNGGVIYGGSAGAIVLGSDIKPCAHIDRNICGLEDTTGLNLVNDLAVACHYRKEHADILRQCSGELQTSILALSERTGLTMERGTMRIAGHVPAMLLNEKSITELPVGSVVGF
jgi:dipeptidase E